MRAAGDVVAGKYRLLRSLARGGMGVVFEATHLGLGTRVAVKVMKAGDLDASALARFDREARTAVKLKSEHVARVLDAGTDHDGGGDPYIVMELLDGVDLSTRLRDEGPLSVHEVALVLVHAAHGLAEAHANGIVHRDIKPANLFRCEDAAGLPVVKVLDFGISKLADRGVGGLSGSFTTQAALLGTPRFMSPEQLESAHDVDARSDVWSLGVTGYQLLSGRAPFEAKELVALLTQITHEPAAPLARLRPDAPAALVLAIERCMQKAPELRFADVAELASVVAQSVDDPELVRIAEHARLVLARAGTAPRPSSSPRAAGGALGFATTVAAPPSDTTESKGLSRTLAEPTTVVAPRPSGPPAPSAVSAIRARRSTTSLVLFIGVAAIGGAFAFHAARSLATHESAPASPAPSPVSSPSTEPTAPAAATTTAPAPPVVTASEPPASTVRRRTIGPRPSHAPTPNVSSSASSPPPVPSALRGLPATRD